MQIKAIKYYIYDIFWLESTDTGIIKSMFSLGFKIYGHSICDKLLTNTENDLDSATVCISYVYSNALVIKDKPLQYNNL